MSLDSPSGKPTLQKFTVLIDEAKTARRNGNEIIQKTTSGNEIRNVLYGNLYPMDA